MEVWQKYNFTIREKSIYELIRAYTLKNKSRGEFRNFISMSKDPRESKNWIHFEKAFERFEQDTTFDPFIFIEAQYRNLAKDKTIFPAQLKTKTAFDRYKEHRDSLKLQDNTSETERIMVNIVDTLKFIRKWWKNNGKKRGDFESFFAPEPGELISDGMSFCMQGMVSKYFMSISRTFNKYYKGLDPDIKWEIISPSELKRHRISLKLDEEAWSFAKEIFGSEVA